jgi:hypothetical protein
MESFAACIAKSHRVYLPLWTCIMKTGLLNLSWSTDSLEFCLNSLNLCREFLDGWYTSKLATTDSFQILKFSYSWSSSHLILQYTTSATEMSSQSKLQISHLFFLPMSKLTVAATYCTTDSQTPGSRLEIGRLMIGWVMNFQTHRSAII